MRKTDHYKDACSLLIETMNSYKEEHSTQLELNLRSLNDRDYQIITSFDQNIIFSINLMYETLKMEDKETSMVEIAKMFM